MNIAKKTESLSIVVQWDEVDDFFHTTYTVTWTSERDNILNPDKVEEQSSYTITGLTLDTVYTITVTAANRCGTGPEYVSSVLLATDITSSTSTNTMAVMSAASSSTSTAITKANTITITASNAVINPSTTTTTETIDLMTSSTNPSAVITSTYTATDPASTLNTNDTTTAEENSKILSISICKYVANT